jgi:UDP-4-amino-4,6-dideoxy-N-acetyl-beta-L-altrosamine N-acetyltransferase
MPEREECNLRPVAEADLEKVLEWRNSERICANMYSDHIISMEEHNAWFEGVKGRNNSIYLVFELHNRPVGLVYFTGIDLANSRSHWGFYLGEEGLPPGTGKAMGKLGLEYAFENLQIRKLCGEAIAFNEASIRFHRKLGFIEEAHFVKHILKNGVHEDVISFALFKDDWLKNKEY